MKFVIYLFLLPIFLLSNELILDDLLSEYEESESLYKKTKQESAGYLLIYSRADLDKMQAYSLKDVLKTIRMYTMQINNIGAIGILNAGASKTSIPPLKLYIDDFEVSTVVQKNALDMYGDMDIYFVDHIEVYQGGSSLAFGNELGSMVIRLYSKDPSRENSTSVQLGVDSKAGANLRAIDAGSMGEYNYLFYANAAKTEFDKYSRNNQELSRDGQRYQAHFQISKDNDFSVELDGIINKTDIFKGFGAAPTGDDSTRAYGYINAIKYFDGNVKRSVAASLEVKKFFNSDAVGVKQPDTPLLANNIDVHIESNTYKVILDKKIIQGKHDLLIGAQLQQNKLNIKTYEGVNVTPNIGPDKLDIYMFYLEELYNINKDHLLAFSAKLDHYRDSFSRNSTEYAVRLGYIALMSNNWSTKLFAIRRYIYPTMLQTTFAPPTYKPNPELDSVNIDMLTGELEYNDGEHRAVFGYAYKVIEDGITFSKTQKQYINNPETLYFNRIYIRGEHKFDYDNKIVIEYYKGYKDDYASPGDGVLIQAFNTFGDFDIYNELVYRAGYSLDYGLGDVKIDAGYDYTLSVGYTINKALKIKVKGENLLDKASETLIDAEGLLKVPAIERRGILTMEYTF